MNQENTIERLEITPGYSISRVIKGGWHLAGGHGDVEQESAIRDMYDFVSAGITTFDCADIYTGVESLIGKFLARYRAAFAAGELPPVQVHTKYVPDYNALATLRKEDTVRIIDRSLRRLGVERLDLVQFAWWNYDVPGYIETALHLAALQKQGKIRLIGVTNFDSRRIAEMKAAGVPIVTNQLQYSILDHRPENDRPEVMTAGGPRTMYLCYGVLAGGFLTDRYLGAPDPSPPLENRSLTKYRLIIDEFGGYELFQEALRLLRGIADQYEVGVAEVAARYILQKPLVGGIIIGVRHSGHLAKLLKLSRFSLSENDIARIGRLLGQSEGPAGPVYELERDKNGPHGSIMKYNLNEE